MSIRVMAQLWERSRLGGTELLCLLAIADFADDTGLAYPSVSTLAKKIRMSKRNTNYLLKKIAESGELAIERNAGPRGCNLFRVQILQGAEFAGVKAIAVEGASGSSKGMQPIAPEPSLNHQEPSILRKCAKLHTDSKPSQSGFEEFWAAYPKKKSKGDAEKAWKSLNPNENLADQILKAVQRAKASVDWLKDSGQFVPYPATWLRGKRWLDDNGGVNTPPIWEQ